MSKIFLSYRREDTIDIAGRIDDRLSPYFGRDAVFFDETISYGDDFRDRLADATGGCKVLLAIIGPKWLEARHAAGPLAGERRLDDPEDYVRFEIETVLRRDGDARVVPVLVGWAPMPKPEELPEVIRELAYRQAVDVRSGRDFHAHIDRLIREIEPHVGKPAVPQRPAREGVKVVPKGLRSFDASDAEFYLGLLPPPFDRNGLPECVRFWKTRIEDRDGEATFPVGLLYGPSGSGKSSLVQAGLRPRLADHVVSIYDAATPAGTERRLVCKLHKECPELDADLDLTASLAALAQGHGLPPDAKIVLLLDQFEQWLFTTPLPEETALFAALRHCDGQHVQVVLMVRDEFVAAASRLLNALEVDVVSGYNTASIDLFGESHARNVLVRFGQAYEQLPERPYEQLAEHQREFLDKAVAGLSHDRKIVPVHLALFADMVKSQPWSGGTLKGPEGATRIGIDFLDEMIRSSRADPKLRRHPRAALRILDALLPPSDTEIKGQRQSARQLIDVAELADRQAEFDGIVAVLSNELRIITPTAADEESAEESADGDNADDGNANEQYYQLTHDYLVPSLHQWIWRELGKTRRGRAERRLAERSKLWNDKPTRRNLPAWWELVNIRCLTDRRRWSDPERRLLRSATRYHTIRASLIAVALAVVVAIAGAVLSSIAADGAINGLMTADVTKVQQEVADVLWYQFWTQSRLTSELDRVLASKKQLEEDRDGERSEEKKKAADKELRIRLGLVGMDDGQVKLLTDLIVDQEDPDWLVVVRDAIQDRPSGEDHNKRLWAVAGDAEESPQRRFRAVCALATFKPATNDASRQRWQSLREFAAAALIGTVSGNPSQFAAWVDLLRPARGQLFEPLKAVYRDANRPPEPRGWAANILSEYTANQPELLAELLMDAANEQQFSALFGKLDADSQEAVAYLQKELTKPLNPDPTAPANEPLAKRQASAAVALFRLGKRDAVWSLLKYAPGDDPRVRSYLIAKLALLKASPTPLIDRLRTKQEPSVRRALILALGDFDTAALAAPQRQKLLPELCRWYQMDPDVGVHGAAEWLLRQWGQEARLEELDKELAETEDQLANRPQAHRRQWYVSKQGHTMALVSKPGEFSMGSPRDEAGHQGNEMLHKQPINYSFGISSKEVTKSQFLRFVPDFSHNQLKSYAPDADCPILGVLWYEAAAYCNWLNWKAEIPQDEWCYVFLREGKRLGPDFMLDAIERSDYRDANDRSDFWQTTEVSWEPEYWKKTGYRLPTEAEWEYSCRAETTTSRHYGQTDELLGTFAKYLNNAQERSWPVGTLKPNDLGLFDMYGNVTEWCQDKYVAYSEQQDLLEALLQAREPSAYRVAASDGRVLRGGSFFNQAQNLRSANRDGDGPTYRYNSFGFRLARTLPLIPVTSFTFNPPQAGSRQNSPRLPFWRSRVVILGTDNARDPSS